MIMSAATSDITREETSSRPWGLARARWRSPRALAAPLTTDVTLPRPAPRPVASRRAMRGAAGGSARPPPLLALLLLAGWSGGAAPGHGPALGPETVADVTLVVIDPGGADSPLSPRASGLLRAYVRGALGQGSASQRVRLAVCRYSEGAGLRVLTADGFTTDQALASAALEQALGPSTADEGGSVGERRVSTIHLLQAVAAALGDDTGLLAGEHRAASPEASRNFVEDQKSPVFSR